MSRLSEKYQTSPPPSRAQSPTASVSSYSSRINYASSLPSPIGSRHNCMSAAAKRYKYLRRLFKFRQMDFQYASWQMFYLLISPQKLFRNFQYRKQTKAQFARDDPAFFVLLCLWLSVTSVIFAFAFYLGVDGFIRLLLYTLFVDTIAFGVIMATIMWVVTNHYMLRPSCSDQDVEWGYAFDVHLNAYFPSVIILHIFLVFLYPALQFSGSWFFSIVFGNLLWVVAIGYYIYITFLGYNALSILHRTRSFLFAFPFLGLFFIVSLLFGWDLGPGLIQFYLLRVGH